MKEGAHTVDERLTVVKSVHPLNIEPVVNHDGKSNFGVRIPNHVLVDVDMFAQANEMTRSKAIVALVEQALLTATDAPSRAPMTTMDDEPGTQNTATGQRAQAWGVLTARKIADALGAEKAADQPMANEFILDGNRVAIKCARPATTQCGLTNTMRDRVDYIICASQTADGAFNLYKVIPAQWEEHAHEPPKHNRNYGYLTHLSRSVYRRIGEDLGEVDFDD